MYHIIRKLLFLLPPEFAHALTLKSLKLANWLGLTRWFPKISPAPCSVMGLSFPNPIGLAAGFDKNGDYVDALASLGFGFIEIGTVTPKPQTGNPRPRLFRLVKQQAIINRMGFNNKGMDYVAKQLKHVKYKGILGINIGKNAATSNENAIDDYIACFRCLAPYASYITINISSPNTENLRQLQQSSSLSPLLQALKYEQQQFQLNHQRYIPLVVKISPDLTDTEITDLAHILLEQKIEGVIATNTTIQRDCISDSLYANEKGGLSGLPLKEQSTHVLKTLHALVGNTIPVIASGGVMNAEAMKEKFQSGAILVQVYSGLIYSGPRILF